MVRRKGNVTAVLVLSCVLLGLAACTPVIVDVPTPTPEPAPLEASTGCLVVTQEGTLADCATYSPQLTAEVQESACAPIVPFDRAQAGRQTAEAGKVASWTLGLGFRTALDGRPLGCLRLYHLAESESPWGEREAVLQPVDGGGILLDTCTLEGPRFDPTQGYASFCSAGAISCRIHLAGWFTDPQVLNLVKNSARGLADPSAVTAISELANDAPEADYPFLTYVAGVGWAEPGVAPDCALQGGVQPIFTVVTDEGSEVAGFSVLHADMGVDWNDTACGFNRWVPGLDWNLVYQSRVVTDNRLTTFYETLTKPSGVLPTTLSSCSTSEPDGRLRMWLGPATLQIGAGGGERFTGYMQGILIDPPNSKPPSALRTH